MANTALLTPSVIAKEALMQLKNNLVFGKLAHRQYKKEFAKVGDTVTIRKPVKFVTTDGATRSNQDVEEGSTSIKLDQRKHVSWNFNTQDLTLSVDEYSERYVKPAMITLAQTVDAYGAALYKKVWNLVGTPGTTPANYAALGAVAQRMTEMAVPKQDRRACLTSEAFHKIAGTLTTLNMPQEAAKAWASGEIGNLAGFNTHESVNLRSHTVGSKAGTPLVNGANQTSAYRDVMKTGVQTLNLKGFTASQAGVLREGDVFTIAGVFAVNPVPGEGSSGKTVLPYLQQFVVRQTVVNSDGSGNAAVTISPAIITSGPYQTVSAAPADSAAITVLGAANQVFSQNLCFHKNALAMVTVPLEMPDGVNWKAQESAEGLSIRLVKDYDINNDVEIVRADILFGWEAIYPELAVRLAG
ncbi:P22 phage major capsid protein family protein [Methylobacterium oxalidis]|uniref:Coat protein n=1 Tax=Methylobacterium oxalidis TaxID=944322 RepID=A0A512J256_9HYPH|nr:P22 phage major capsid protein family protein [Methylobacterium oxalidis]GEP04035.1 hypothetical protein MOX02_20730 [Methylobacterium oxalidis]GJE34840.1 hypothetical protein LDDCCGHA_5055 [Methylobacterium oxalidis]GLS64066.1 hypothetical protein GCM10007888_24470 [Methylobacterium oxalidis]